MEETSSAWELYSCQHILTLLQDQANSLPDTESKIKLALTGLEKLPTPLPALFPTKRKSKQESFTLRLKLDRSFGVDMRNKQKLLNVCKLYSESIAYAEPGSVELGLAYASRSACLFHLGKIDECVRDVNRALELSYPDHLKPNLLRRKLKCLRLLGNQEADKVCQEAHLLLERVTLDDAKKDQMKKSINEAAKVDKNPRFKQISLDMPNFVCHKDISSVSNALDLINSENMGRHFVANRNIKPGEILIAEKPYVQDLDLGNEYTHCSHCLVRAWDGIPCNFCTNTIYCSQKCKDVAWKQYHDIECILKEFNSRSELSKICIGAIPISLKLTLLAVREFGSIEKLKNELNKIDECGDDIKKCFSEDGILHSDQYRTIHSLLTHEAKKESCEVSSLITKTALVLYYINKYTDFFGTSGKDIFSLCKNDDALFFGKLLIENYFKIEINSYEFKEIKTTEYIGIGATVGCATSFLNHSCDPNILICSVTKDNSVQSVIYSLKPILKGSSLFHNYGCNFLSTPKNARNNFLKPYFFECNCNACKHNWPLIENLPSIKTQVNSCDKKTREAFSTAATLMFEWQDIIFSDNFDQVKNAATIIEPLTNSIAILSRTVKEPIREYYEILSFYKLVISKIYGNSFRL